MRIVSWNKMESCFDGDFVYKYFFDVRWTEEAIKTMGALGHLQYYGSFPRPLFQIQCDDGTIIKGVQDINECRVLFARDGPNMAKERFEKSFGAAFE